MHIGYFCLASNHINVLNELNADFEDTGSKEKGQL